MTPPLPPPPLPDAGARKLAAAVRWARVSAASLVGFGMASAAACVREPRSAGFAVSVAVLASGVFEWIWAKRWRGGDRRAPGRLALNQGALGLAIAAYAAWQAAHLAPEAVQEALAGPLVETVLGRLSREEAAWLLELLPLLVRALYGVVGVAALVGCGGTALYYLSRRRFTATPPPR